MRNEQEFAKHKKGKDSLADGTAIKKGQKYGVVPYLGTKKKKIHSL